MSAECGKGWSGRCAAAKSKKCACRCGGVNHGTDRPIPETSEPTGVLQDLLNTIDMLNGGQLPRRFVNGFCFKGYFGKRSVTDLAVCGRVVIATERNDNPGTSITNAAEALSAAIRERFGDDVIVVEHYPLRGDMRDPIRESISRVTMNERGIAEWKPLTRTMLARLIADQSTSALAVA